METLINIILFIYHFIVSLVCFFIPSSWRYKDISQDIVLITGAASGLGRLLAIKLAKSVNTLVLIDVNQAGLEATAQQVQAIEGKTIARCRTYVCDVSQPEMVKKLAGQVKNDVGSVTILINNAGVVSGKHFMQLTPEDVSKTFGVNVFSHYWINQAFLPDMMSINQGHIITLASVASFCGIPQMSDYSASKAAVYMLHDCLAGELDSLGYNGIKLTAVCPFFIDTGMFNGVSTWAFPLLRQDSVTDSIIRAIRTNQSMLVLPKLFYLVIWLKFTLPVKCYQAINQICKGHKMMATFKKIR